MAIKAIIDSLDSVEEEYRSLYEEKDGKFVLAIEGIESHPGAAALKAALDRVRGEKRTLSDKLTAAESRLEGLPEDFDREAFETLRQQAEGKEPPKIEERLAAQKTQLEAKFAKDRERLEARANKLDSTLRRVMVDDGLTKALLDAGIDKNYLPAAKALLKEKGQIKLVEDDVAIQVFADDGVNDRTPLSDYVRSWAGQDEGKVFVAKPTGGDAKGGDGRQFSDNPWDSSNGKKPNLTKQQQLVQENPSKARQMAQAAGVTPNW
ncbi:hypothetical protein [Sinorhizobium meliloti]|uniref:hypothetical protein n=1 Tax=Rhizobium meliloti TaxID=382 RepID=UPI000FD4641F|nr:hypothetical protein [Sinorhizobium meliloti]RVM02683.1 hypothetical protein CN125_32370 [Sinorhizobium meliloti]RVM40216.1 hypothetical protein CN121_31435 [Sinorhizobium meliloti]RVM56154.1 hypothetical protein CN124_32090 [Sinorhizobium meliloti]RVM60126.1 hypothetical protein CN123_31185 [Sinorhizobium meliloti]RVM76759.1 hypothetical protein CN117_30925 [Sinorhizobium meliloti]